MKANPSVNPDRKATRCARSLGFGAVLLVVTALASGCGGSGGSKALDEMSKCGDWNKASVGERVAFVEKAGYRESNIRVRGNWAAVKLTHPKLKVASFLAAQVTGYCASSDASTAGSVSGAIEGTALALGITKKSG